MRKVFKKTFQPLEIALKKALGIKKVCKGQILDSSGFVCNEREKITRFVLFIPLFQKIRTLISVSEFNNGAIASNGGATRA